MGRGYVLEHCISTFNHIKREEIYKEYVTETLRHIAKGVGYEIKVSYAELVDVKPEQEETRDPDEIIDGIKGKIAMLSSGEVSK